MFSETKVKVRFSETDALGHVNNVSFFVYIEQARVSFLESLEERSSISDWRFIVGHVSCDFIQQAYFNQELTIQSVVTKIGNTSFRLKHHILDSLTGQVVARGESVLIQFDFDKQKSDPLTPVLVEKLQQYLVEE